MEKIQQKGVLITIALLLSLVMHIWLSYETTWEIINSKLQFMVWPGLFFMYVLQSILPESITVQNDPLPHTNVMLASLIFNYFVWSILFTIIIIAIRKWKMK